MKFIFFKYIKKTILKTKNFYRKIYSYPILKYGKNHINEYWQTRKVNYEEIKPNDFQIERAKLFNLFIDQKNATLLDIGSGDGAQLIAINKICSNIKIIGSDKDKFASDIMKKSKFKFHCINEKNSISNLIKNYCPTYVSLFEVIEHMYSPEELVLELLNNINIKKIFISVPNTGFFIHRIRLLTGRFPLQWIAAPNEHIRFWTLKDLNWWLKYLNLESKSTIVPYKGIPILNKFLPNLFAEGSFIIINNN